MKELLKNQMLAALATLHQCIIFCSDDKWEESDNDAPFSQVLFHTLFYIDYYLSLNENEFKTQQFHKDNMNIFRAYEELEYKKAIETYTKNEIKLYFDFCYNKINGYFEIIENKDLIAKTGIKNMKIMELLIYITRHIQHHAAQLGLRIQQKSGKELKWISSGWII